MLDPLGLLGQCEKLKSKVEKLQEIIYEMEAEKVTLVENIEVQDLRSYAAFIMNMC